MEEMFAERLITVTASGKNEIGLLDVAINVLGYVQLHAKRKDNILTLRCSTRQQVLDAMYTLIGMEFSTVMVTKI